MKPYTPFVVLGGVFAVLLLLKHSRAGDWLNRRVAAGEPRRLQKPAYAVLRREIGVVGKELEGLSYEGILGIENKQSGSLDLGNHFREVDGFHLSFSAEIYDIANNGDLHICIDGRCEELRSFFAALPSYSFIKRKDGTVHYGDS